MGSGIPLFTYSHLVSRQRSYFVEEQLPDWKKSTDEITNDTHLTTLMSREFFVVSSYFLNGAR